MIKENQQRVEASTASIRLNQDAVSDSTGAIDQNERAVLASTVAITENERAVEQSTKAIVQNQKILSDVTSTMQTLTPSQPRMKWIAAVVIAALIALYGAVIALLISSLRTGRALHTIKTKLAGNQRRTAHVSRFDYV